MSYLVLARKYRPRNFSEMVGQEHVVQALSNALVQQRLHHAYLFTGTRGVGKTTVSRILAKSLNCTGVDGHGGITAAPCGVCPACTEIDSGRFPDYTELDAASNRGVDEVQGLLEQAVYKPAQGRFKVFMIDEVHMLTNTAFNAMLKTLEEPPEYLKFVLATTDPQKVPVTVLSRCLQFNLRPMAPETIQEHLGRVLVQEQIASEPQALRLLSRSARGSMRDALSLTDQAIAFGGGQLQEASVRQMLGAVDSSHVFGLIDALARGDGAAVVDTVDQLRHQGLSAASTLEDMAVQLQRMAVLQAVPDKARASAAEDDVDQQEVLRLSQEMPADETQLLYSIALHGRAELGLAPDEYAALTMALLRLLAFKPAGSAEKKTLNNALAQPPKAPTPTPPPPAAATIPAAAAPVAVSAPPASLQPAAAVRAPTPAPTPTSAPAPTPVVAAAEVQLPPAIAPVVDAVKLPVRTAEDLIPTRVAAPLAPVAVEPPTPAQTEQELVEEEQPQSHDDDAAPLADNEGDDDGDIPSSSADDDAPYFDEVPAEAYADDEDTVSAGAPAAEANTAGLPPVAEERASLIALPVQTPQASDFDRPANFGENLGRVPAEFEDTAEGRFWNDTVTQLVQAEAVTAVARQLALRSQLLKRDADEWQLRVDLESLAQPGTVERLRTALVAAGLVGKIQVSVGAVDDSPARRKAHAVQARQRAAEATVRQDPYVQSLIQQFGAKIVPGSIQPL
ncbi:DNA polymerase III subunit gamma/tau [Comamonas piscis]|uniref:DNA polymerase III subunit gamma/tau n=1 Tax=Comamonas piscis TaxID=1562974 RepID=A0A7G5EI28_9BURK|nr:DNA polymerase III subunit gamma/tau [Comamonas piscis]QMV73653.1 DNA polymerase III subunit gamma/tau [Comamonas piscis]WSO32076.1 DNA polymerase III subunit gamma/tau [Comamonas piscis]